MTTKVFEAALGIAAPWSVGAVDFDEATKVLTVRIDFTPGTCVMRSKVEPMKEVAAMVLSHLEGIVAWAQTRQTNDFLEAINGLFQAAKRRARGFGRLSTIKAVIFLIAGKLDFHAINPHARQPT